MNEPNALEKAVLYKLFEGSQAALASLRRQAECAKVTSREPTGVGFYTSFELPRTIDVASGLPPKVIFGDVAATVLKLAHGAGFLVYIYDGKITMLEGYCYDEK